MGDRRGFLYRADAMHTGGRSWQIRLRNAEIARAARRHYLRDRDPISFLCECDDPQCDAYVKLLLPPYDRLRDERLYIVAPDHTILAGRLQNRSETFDSYRTPAYGGAATAG